VFGRVFKIVVVVLAVAVAVVVLHDVVLFDAYKFVAERNERTPERLRADQVRDQTVVTEAEVARRAKWHHGDPPCFVYSTGRPTVEAIAPIVDEMAAVGVLHQARATFPLWSYWAQQDERRRHGPETDEELLDFYRYFGWRTHFLIALNRDRIIAELHAETPGEKADARAEIAAMESRYDPDDVRAARAFWYAHRLALSPPALIQVRHELEKRAGRVAAP
jgi:hypothetical protein